MHNLYKPFAALVGLGLLATTSLQAADLPDPDGKPADLSKPAKVFILLGQSNMLGMGHVTGDKPGSLEDAVKNGNLYPFLIEDDGKWTERQDVRHVGVMQARGNMKLTHNEWMTIKGGKIGPEYGIGHQIGPGSHQNRPGTG